MGAMFDVKAMARFDFRVRTLPPIARIMWTELMWAMQDAGGSALQSASWKPNHADIAIMAAVPESEVEANLQAILDRGLLARDAEGALSSPLLQAQAHRSEVNRINGKLGGARRKQQAEDRRQRELPAMGLPAPSARAESEPKANGAPAAPGVPLAKLKLDPALAKQAVTDEMFHRAGRMAMEAAGFDPVTWRGNYGIVRQWLADGATPETIEDTIAAVMARGNVQPTHLGYFSKAIAAGIQRGGAGAGSPVWAPGFEAATRAYIDGGYKGEIPRPEDFRAGGKHAVAA